MSIGINATDAGLYNATGSEDLSSYEGQGVYWNGSAWAPASLTSQVVTNQLGNSEAIGVVVQAAETTEPLGIAYWSQRGYVQVKAGTGGVTAGDFCVPEYAASGTDRGRFIDETAFHPGMIVWGVAMQTVAEDATFWLDMGQGFRVTAPFSTAVTAIAEATAHTLTAAEIFGGQVKQDPAGGAVTTTTDTAANIILAFAARGYAVGSTFLMTLTNTADAAETITLAAGSGVTVSNAAANLAVVQNTGCVLAFHYASATTVGLSVLKGPNA